MADSMFGSQEQRLMNDLKAAKAEARAVATTVERQRLAEMLERRNAVQACRVAFHRLRHNTQAARSHSRLVGCRARRTELNTDPPDVLRGSHAPVASRRTLTPPPHAATLQGNSSFRPRA